MNKIKYNGVYEEKFKGKRNIFTINLAPGNKVYGEDLIKIKNIEYRSWDPRRSKLGAAILKHLKNYPFKQGSKVLYLGAASGTTPSHVSDIIGKQGFVYALDFAYRVVRDLYFVCKKRKNMAPMYYDAMFPEQYAHLVDKVDIVYMDIAQRNQVEIFVKNVRVYLKKKGIGLLFLKARSVDVSLKPRIVYKTVRKELEKYYKVIEQIELEPFEKDHCLFVIKK